MAFMNNADEPDLEIHDPRQVARRRSNRALAARLLQKLPESWPGPNSKQKMTQKFQGWLAKQRAKFVQWSHLRPTKAKSNLPLLTIQRDHSIFASGDSTKKDTFNVWLKATNQATRAIRLEAIPDSRLPAGGPGMTYYEGKKGDFFLTEIEVFADGEKVPIRAASHNYAKNTFGQPASAQLATDGDVQTGWSIHGRIGERHTAVFQLAKPVEAGRSLRIKMIFCRHFSCALGRFRFSATSQENAIAQNWKTEIEGLLGRKLLSKAQRQTLFEAFLLQSPELKKQSSRIKQLLKKLTPGTSLVMRERPKHHPRDTHIHRRGEYLQPKAKVAAATPAVLHSFRVGERRNRLGFARWLVDRRNPLTARVVVNRQWAAIFGQGIVTTIGDFGLQGAPPTHPRLLDWLAVEFMEKGWSIKQMHRLIVTSATYRQSANSDRSIWLRGVPRKRLEAEVIRDSVLRSAGVLTNRLRGKPVYPPQPSGAGGLAWGASGWKTSSGSDRYRRSVYIFLKRTAPFAMLSTFDAPSGEACVARRNRSNTALQALTILNDVMFVEAAQLFAASLVRSPGSDEQRVAAAFRRVLTRDPNAAERRLLLAYVRRQRERIGNSELKAAAIAGKGANVQERAVWTALARVLFSLDESQTRN